MLHANTTRESRSGPYLRRKLFRCAQRALAVLGLLFLVYHAGFELTEMVSPSMAPTLRGEAPDPGDFVLSERISYWLRGPRRWEVVAFRSPDGLDVMKRVVGLPGETVAIDGGRVRIDGMPRDPPPSLSFLYYHGVSLVAPGRELYCGNGHFVLGDNSRDSDDSRFNGPVALERIRKRAWLVVWPPARVGWVNP